MTSDEKTFKQRFCEHFDCAPRNFVKKAHKRCLQSRPTALAGLFIFFSPPEDAALIVQAGEMTTRSGLDDLVNDYHYRQQFTGGFLSGLLKSRISGQLLIDLFAEVSKPLK